MKRCKSVKDGVNSLIIKNQASIKSSWDYVKAGSKDLTDSVTIGSLTYPLFYWRFDPQVEAIERNARKNIGGSISLKMSGVVGKDCSLEAFLYKALDIAEWALGSEIKKLTAYVNKNAANVILLMKNDKVASLELSSCLKKGTPEQTRITAWGREGMESTRVVSTKIRPESIYMFTNKTTPYTFNDATIDLYGLALDDATKAVAIYKLLIGDSDLSFYLERDKKLKYYIEKVFESDKTNESIIF